MSGVYDMDDLHATLSDLYDTAERQNSHIKQLHGALIAIAAGISAITILLSEDVRAREPAAYNRATEAILQKTKEWEQMIKEVNE